MPIQPFLRAALNFYDPTTFVYLFCKALSPIQKQMVWI